MRIRLSLVLVGILALGMVGGVASPQKITFFSTQLAPIAEAEWMRNQLALFTEETGIEVTFLATDVYGEYADRVLADYRTGRGEFSLLGMLHGDVLGVMEVVGDVSDELSQLQALGDRTFTPAFVNLGQIEGIQAYIPWMQAAYVMVVNKKALPYMPVRMATEGLTYGVLLEWAKAIYEATGEPMLGIPAGPSSLLKRFLHGHIYPSFTGAQMKNFNTPEAVAMWEYMVELWKYVNPSAPIWDAMDTPLLTEEVWIAWDHNARVKEALVQRPDDFIVLPCPAGPKGRGVITVIAGLVIPETSSDPESAYKLIEYLTRPEVQVATLENVGFFPVVAEAAGAVPAGGLKLLADGVNAQSGAPDVIVSIIPGGLGPRSGEFTKIYVDAFNEIVLKGRPIQEVLDEQGALLEALWEETGAPLPVPDINLP